MSFQKGLVILSICALVRHSEAGLAASKGAAKQDSAYFSSPNLVVPMGSSALVCSSRGGCFVATGSTFGALSDPPIDLDENIRSLAAMSATRALYCYKGCKPKAGTSACDPASKNSCSILTVSSTTVTVGTPYEFTQSSPTGMWTAVGAGSLTTTSGVVCGLFDGATDVYCAIAMASGSSVSVGTLVKVGGKTSPTNQRQLSVTGLSTSLAVVCYSALNTNHLACNELQVSGDSITAGAQVLSRADQGQVTVAAISASKLSATSFVICYDFTKLSDQKTLCNYMSTSPLLSGSAYQVSGKGAMSVSVAALSASTAIVCYKEKSPYKDACVDMDLTQKTCKLGSAWNPARGEDMRSMLKVVKASSASALACSGGRSDTGCDTLSVDNTRSACTMHSPGTYCDPEGGECNQGTSGSSSGSTSGSGSTGNNEGTSSGTSSGGATGATPTVTSGSDALRLGTVLAVLGIAAQM